MDIRTAAGIRQKSVLVDTNLLLLLLLGAFDPARIHKFKRTQQFSDQDFYLLVNFLNTFDKVLTTPHILTEVSNLGGQLGSDFKKAFFAVYAKSLQKLEEVFRASIEIVATDLFSNLGLTDAAIGLVCSDAMIVLTDDSVLAQTLATKGIRALPFDILRAYSSAQI